MYQKVANNTKQIKGKQSMGNKQNKLKILTENEIEQMWHFKSGNVLDSVENEKR